MISPALKMIAPTGMAHKDQIGSLIREMMFDTTTLRVTIEPEKDKGQRTRSKISYTTHEPTPKPDKSYLQSPRKSKRINNRTASSDGDVFGPQAKHDSREDVLQSPQRSQRLLDCRRSTDDNKDDGERKVTQGRHLIGTITKQLI